MQTVGDITGLLIRARQGDVGAYHDLYPAVYDRLRAIAGGYFRHQRPDQTLQATALVHEAYLKLIDQSGADWRDRAHFFAVAAQAMRQILVDHARSRAAAKRGSGWRRVTLDQVDHEAGRPSDESRMQDVLWLDDALSELSRVAPRQTRIVELRFFAGLSVNEIAEAVGVSPRTVDLDWKLARAWLARRLNQTDDE